VSRLEATRPPPLIERGVHLNDRDRADLIDAWIDAELRPGGLGGDESRPIEALFFTRIS
jgi:hypothetical protein